MATTTHTTTLNFTGTTKLVVTWTEDDQPTYRKLKITKMVFTSTKSGGLAKKWLLDCYYNNDSLVYDSKSDGGSWTLAKGTTSRTMEPKNTYIQWDKRMDGRYVGKVALFAGLFESGRDTDEQGYAYYDTGTISSSYWVSAKTQYNVVINFNGSGAANQTLTKWYNETLTLPAAPTRTNYAFNRFNTNTSNTGTGYAAKASYTANAAATLYAIWNPKISFNANGGSGAPTTQTKTFGQALKLSTVKPTRVGYTFKGWGTSSSATSASYQAGGTYPAGSNAATTLYAVWEPTPPTIIGRAYRTTRESSDTGNKMVTDASAYPEADTGTSAVVVLTVSSASDNGAIKSVRLTEPESSLDVSFTLDPEPTSASLYFVLGDTGTYSADVTYRFTAAVTYSVDGTTVTTPATAYINLAKAYFLVDWRAGGTGMAIGGPATKDNALQSYLPIRLEDSGLSATDETPSANYWGKGFEIYDNSGAKRGYLRGCSFPSGIQGIQLETYRIVNGSDKFNNIRLLIDANGNCNIHVSDAAAWHNALGYTPPTAIPLSSAALAYSSGQTPRYAKQGYMVTVYGAVKPKSDVSAGGTLDIGTLPAGYRPPQDISVLCQGSGQAVWLLQVTTSGAMTASRYRTGNTNNAMTTGVWLTFSATYPTTTL